MKGGMIGPNICLRISELQIWNGSVSLVFPQTQPGRDLTGDLMEVGEGREGRAGEESDNFLRFPTNTPSPA